MEELLKVRALKTYYYTPLGIIKAVNGLSFEVKSGEVLGIVGELGAGKTTLGRSILRVVPEPGRIVSGEVVFKGVDLLKLSDTEITKIRGRDISLIPETPILSLNPSFTVEDQIKDALKVHLNYSDREARREALRLMEQVAIPDRESILKAFPHQLSGGMCQRILIAMAFACKPSLVIADEPTTSVDVITQAQIVRLIRKMQNEYGSSLLFITHDVALASKVCSRIGVMYAGKLLEIGPTESVLNTPKHPYVKELIKVAFSLRVSKATRGYLYVIKGNPPSPTQTLEGCAFKPRCKEKLKECSGGESVPMAEVGKDHLVACLLYGK